MPQIMDRYMYNIFKSGYFEDKCVDLFLGKIFEYEYFIAICVGLLHGAIQW